MTKYHNIAKTAAIAFAIGAAMPAISQAAEEVVVDGNGTHHYVFYKDHDIYFSPETKVYYWKAADGSWTSGATLPSDRVAYVREGGVNIQLDTDRPYTRNDYVIAHYRTLPRDNQ